MPDSAGAYDPRVDLAVGAGALRGPGLIQVEIKQRKTRQPGIAGGAATVLNVRPSASRDRLDPFWWMLHQLRARTRAAAAPNDPLFADEHGSPVTRRRSKGSFAPPPGVPPSRSTPLASAS